MKNRYFPGHFSIWYPRVPLMRLVPKVAFFQVLLEGLESKLPQTAAEAGYRKMWFSTDFFKSTSLAHHSLMFSNFPRSSLLYSRYDDRGKWFQRTFYVTSSLPSLIICSSFIRKLMIEGSLEHTKGWSREVLFISHRSTVHCTYIELSLLPIFHNIRYVS